MEVTTTYERSACVQALIDAGLPLTPPETGIRYSYNELARLREDPATGKPVDLWHAERRAIATAAVAARRGERAA